MNTEMQTENYIKSSLHSISPYVGKLRPEVASSLVHEFSGNDDLVFDPFCGSGTVTLEAWINKRETIGIDLNPYAYLLTQAKLNPYPSFKDAKKKLDIYVVSIKNNDVHTDLRKVPNWVKDFFHPKTLKEISLWVRILLDNHEWFLLACLMGILHHQRSGFLSYPSSHGAPYLRIRKYPREQFPEMYEYRPVNDRLLKKVERTYKNTSILDYSIMRTIYNGNTLDFDIKSNRKIAIITSPPYMKSLTYARDNRLRLWFLGYSNWQELDKNISMSRNEFIVLMENCFQKWSNIQEHDDYCVLVIGDIEFDKSNHITLPTAIYETAKKYNYRLEEIRDYPVNTDRKFEKKDTQMKTEKICVLRRI